MLFSSKLLKVTRYYTIPHLNLFKSIACYYTLPSTNVKALLYNVLANHFGT